jgi:hypothetical protein
MLKTCLGADKMKLLLENWRQYLNERVYGNLITAYSRTSRLSNIRSMLKNGWRIGDYGDFEPGIYLVYNFEESEYADRWYGTYIMKFAIKAHNKLLIFDPDAAKTVYGKNSDLRSQVESIDPELLEDKRVEKWLVSKEKYGATSSGFYGLPGVLKESINGIMINTGPKKDGYVAVIYKPENVLTMTSWAKIPEVYSAGKLPREEWRKSVHVAGAEGEGMAAGSQELLYKLIEKYDGDVYKLKTNPPTQEDLEAIAETIRYPEPTEEENLRALKEFYIEYYAYPYSIDDMTLEELIEEIEITDDIDFSGSSATEIIDEMLAFETGEPISDFIPGKESSLIDVKRFLNIRDRGARDFEAQTFDQYLEWMKKIGLDPQKRTEPYGRKTLEWNREVDGIQLPQRIKLA